jgi:hypothetical protein
LLAEVGGKLFSIIAQDRLAEQCADAMPRSSAVLRQILRPQVQVAESLAWHTAQSRQCSSSARGGMWRLGFKHNDDAPASRAMRKLAALKRAL